MDRKLIIVLVSGAVVMAFTLFLLYPRSPQPGSQKYKFMHCPKCGLEVPYNPDLAGKPCSRCGPFGPEMVPTTEPVALTGGSPSPFNLMFLAILFELNVLIIALLYVQHRVRKEKAKVEEEYLYFRCVHCRRKLRYASSKAGQKGQCPRCKHNLIFDHGTPDEEEA
jgi:hypothetical protein